MCRPQLGSAVSALADAIVPLAVPTESKEQQQGKRAKKEKRQPAKKEAAAPVEESEKVIAERFRTKLCRNFLEKGSCPYESRCMFAHGEQQLRTTEMNLRDGLLNEEAIRQFKRMLVLKSRAQAAHLKHMQMAEEKAARQLCSPRTDSSNDLTSENSEHSSHSSTPSTYRHDPYAFKAIAKPCEWDAADVFTGTRLYVRTH